MHWRNVGTQPVVIDGQEVPPGGDCASVSDLAFLQAIGAIVPVPAPAAPAGDDAGEEDEAAACS